MKTQIKEYLTMAVKFSADETQDMLDERGEKGWRLVCSYVGGNWLIMERDKTIDVCKECGK